MIQLKSLQVAIKFLIARGHSKRGVLGRECANIPGDLGSLDQLDQQEKQQKTCRIVQKLDFRELDHIGTAH